ncbi:MAG: amidohydrolase family protein [Synechococcus sp.]
MNTAAISHVQGWAPRQLVLADAVDTQQVAIPHRSDGLVPVALHWHGGRMSSVRLLRDNHDVPEQLLLPRLVEPHAHLDKAFSWSQAPNLDGTYNGALAANLTEHQTRTATLVRSRAERALQQAFRHGLRAIRSHIDSLGPGADCSWEALLDAQTCWREQLTLQLVALVPIEHWSTAAGKALAQRVAAAGGLLGGVLVPPCAGRAQRQALRQMLQLADQLGCGIDLHIDEAQTRAGEGLQQLLHALDRTPVQVPITCSHASSLALMPQHRLQRIIRRMAGHHLQVVALPLSNGWLLGRQPGRSPLVRPLAPILQLQRGGVRVAVGGDNVQDPWFPGGNFDPVSLISQCLPLAQLAPWDHLGLMPFTTEAARLMALSWDGTLQRGAPADLLILKASNWSAALSQAPHRELVVSGALQPH